MKSEIKNARMFSQFQPTAPNSHFVSGLQRKIHRTSMALAVLGLMLFLGLVAQAATFHVTTTTDNNNNANATAGSLRKAIVDANANPGTDTIDFNIPGAGVHTFSLTTPLPTITDPVVIDGYTQPNASANTLANGDNAVLLIEITGTNPLNLSGSNGLEISAGGTTVRGLIINGFPGTSSKFPSGILLTTKGNNVITGNFLGINANGTTKIPNAYGVSIDGCGNNRIGGSTPAERNLISGNDRSGVDVENSPVGNAIVGNFIGTDRTGTTAVANYLGIAVGQTVATTNAVTIGGLTSAARNIISGNTYSGLFLTASGSGIQVQGNYIGTDVTGNNSLGNEHGIYCYASGTTIGGDMTGARNIISGNHSNAVVIMDTSDVLVLSNWIGYGANGIAQLGTGSFGIAIVNSSNNTIGAPGGLGNAIAFSGGTGVRVTDGAGAPPGSSHGNRISANSIGENGNLGIDLGGNNVTANDLGDGDQGANGFQNYPVLSRAALISNGLTFIAGSFNSTASQKFRIELFANAAPDSSGFGPGQTFMGAFDVTTDANGNASFNNGGYTGVVLGQCISATATDSGGNTSEFSKCLPVTPDGPGSLQFSSAGYSASENGGQATITVKRTGGSFGTDTVQYAVVGGGTATPGSDYTTVSGTLIWGDFDSADKTFTIAINDDSLNETNETINLTLSNPTNGAALVSPSTAVLTITDNDSLPTISISDVSQPEGNSGNTNFTFNVTLSAASGQAVKVNYSTAEATAQAGSDYQSANGVINFAPGETAKQINVSASGDTQPEPDETFTVSLFNLINVGVGKATGVGTIVNDDGSPPAGTLQFSAAAYSVNENAGQATITVKRVGGSFGAVSLKYLPATGGTANAGSDFSAPAGFLNWADGDLADKTFTIPITDDSLDEPDETINYTLSSPTNGATLGSPSSAVITIVDDDPAPSVSIDDASLAEGNSGATTFTFTVSLSAASGQTVSVNYTTADNTAFETSDYQAANGVVTFAPGETSKQVTVQVNGDTQVESNETFVVNLYNLINASVGKVTAVGTIVNDDSNSTSTTIQFSQAIYSVQEDLGAMTVTVTRSGDTSAAASVDYATVDGSAAQKADFEYAAGTLTFAAGETSKTITVLLNEDALVEGNEAFKVTLSNPAGAVLGPQSSTTTTIVDDLSEPMLSPVDDAQSFVHMHYHDFLNREPDAAGLAFWTSQITACGTDAKCIDAARVNVSASFFLSIEFQETAYLLYLMQKESYTSMPKYASFMRDLQEVSRGVVVNAPGWQQKLADNQKQFADKWSNRPEFKAAYDALSNDAYVSALYKNAGIAAPQTEKDKLVAALNTASMNRSAVLLQVAGDATFRQQEQNAAFVMMEYFGYLRRDPSASPDADLSGYNFWLNKLNQFKGNYVDAQMIKAFITSFEYRQRFGQ